MGPPFGIERNSPNRRRRSEISLLRTVSKIAQSISRKICQKVLNMRLFPNEIGGRGWTKMYGFYPSFSLPTTVMQRNYEVLLVSQFTLYGFLKGNELDFHMAMPPEKAKPFYTSVVDRFKKSYNPDAIKDGVFGATMKVNLVNDGPVTMQLDS
ncbi:hypothetical protein UlMin_028687 [Ulmus minor]